MRLNKAQLFSITNRERRSSQVKWFKDFLNIDVPSDRLGPIITAAAYEDLVKKRLGVLPMANAPSAGNVREHPKVRLLQKIQ
jgi:hypothetical protein